MWRITILGYYGQKNTGDDALAVTVLRGIGQHMAQAHFYIHSDPLVVPSGFRVSFAPSGWAVKIRGLRRLSLIFRSMYWADIVVLGGGSVIHDLLGPSHLIAKVRFFKHLKVLGKKLAAVGLGIGPLRTPQGKAAARDLLKLFDFVAVRDERSLEEARSISAPVTEVAFDPAVLLEKAGLPEWRDDPYLTKDPHRPILAYQFVTSIVFWDTGKVLTESVFKNWCALCRMSNGAKPKYGYSSLMATRFTEICLCCVIYRSHLKTGFTAKLCLILQTHL